MISDAERLTWTCEETAERMGVPLRTVQALCARGELPAVKLANKWLVLPDRLRDQLGVPEPNPTPEILREMRRLLLDLEAKVTELMATHATEG